MSADRLRRYSTSTLWHFRSFGPDDLLQVKPADVRAAVQLDNGVSLSEPPALTVKLVFNGEPATTFQAPLGKIRAGISLGPDVGAAKTGKHWYLFALSAAGVQSFRRLQKYLRTHIGPDGNFPHGTFTFSVNVQGLDLSGAARKRARAQGKLYLQTRLSLNQTDGFYTLFNGRFPADFSENGTDSAG
ncbi:MAG TPA: hypothetical protein VFK24_08115 [Gammaproteobacteria bacterium]|nr:hypothetical protein [Gammaproteobacteria bacterium]